MTTSSPTELNTDQSQGQSSLTRTPLPPAALRNLIEGDGSFLLTTEKDGSITYATETLPRLLRISPSPQTLKSLIHPESHSKIQALLDGEGKEMVLLLHSKDDTGSRAFRCRARKRTARGVEYVDVMLLDIDEQYRLRRQLTHAQRLEPVGIMASGIAHDVNNQLTALLGQLTVATTLMNPGEPSRECLAAAEQAALRAAEMTGQLLSYVRKKDLEEQYFKTHDFFRETLSLIRHVMPAEIEVNLQFNDLDCTFLGDPTGLQQVFLNLAVNSRDAMEGRGDFTIEVSAAKTAGNTPHTLLVRVSDSGPGIPKEIQTDIFEPFFTTKEAGDGTGLGLCMAHTIVKKHGGRIQIDQEASQGCHFVLHLPIKTPIQDSCSNILRIESPQVVLVVDDDQFVRSTLQSSLEMLGYKVLTAINGEEAYEVCAAEASPPALALVDYSMPGIRGDKVCKHLKEQYGMPVVLTSAFKEAAQANKEFNFPFISKPFSVDELTEVIEMQLNESTPSRAA